MSGTVTGARRLRLVDLESKDLLEPLIHLEQSAYPEDGEES